MGSPPDLVAGKPAPPLYLLCASGWASNPSRVLAVGDRLDTDIEGAVAAGMDSLLVLTGVDDLAACLEAPLSRRPTWWLPTSRALLVDPEDAGAALGALTWPYAPYTPHATPAAAPTSVRRWSRRGAWSGGAAHR